MLWQTKFFESTSGRDLSNDINAFLQEKEVSEWHKPKILYKVVNKIGLLYTAIVFFCKEEEEN